MDRRFQGIVAMRHGKHEAGLALLQVAVNDLHNAGYALYHTAALAELPDALGRTGQIGSPLRVIDEALGQSTRTDERWCMAELLRVKSRNAFASSHANSHRAGRGSPSAIARLGAPVQ
jgi:hypothetical protein